MKYDTHSFNVPVAQALRSIEKAILLREINNALEWKLAQKTLQGGLPWFYLAAQAAAEKMPYLSAKSIARWLAELEQQGILFAARLAPKGYDQTKFYTLNFEAWSALLRAEQPNQAQCETWKIHVGSIATALMANRNATAELEQQLRDDMQTLTPKTTISQNENWISQNENWISQNENAREKGAKNAISISQNENWISQNEQPITTQVSTHSLLHTSSSSFGVFQEKTPTQQKSKVGSEIETTPTSASAKKEKKVAPKKEKEAATFEQISALPSCTPITREQAEIVLSNTETGNAIGNKILQLSIMHRFDVQAQQPNATARRKYNVTPHAIFSMRNIIAGRIKLGSNPELMLQFTEEQIRLGNIWVALWSSGNNAFDKWVLNIKNTKTKNSNGNTTIFSKLLSGF